METGVPGADKASLPGRASQSGAGDLSLKSRDLQFPRRIFSSHAANGLGAAPSDGSHDMHIINICAILEANDSSHISAALDSGA